MVAICSKRTCTIWVIAAVATLVLGVIALSAHFELSSIEDDYDIFNVTEQDGTTHTLQADYDFKYSTGDAEGMTYDNLKPNPGWEGEFKLDGNMDISDLDLSTEEQARIDKLMPERIAELEANTEAQDAAKQIKWSMSPFAIVGGLTAGALLVLGFLAIMTNCEMCNGLNITCYDCGSPAVAMEPGVADAMSAGLNLGQTGAEAAAVTYAPGGKTYGSQSVAQKAIHLPPPPLPHSPPRLTPEGQMIEDRRRLEEHPSQAISGLTLWQAAPILVIVPLLSSYLAHRCISVYRHYRARKPAVRILSSRRPSDVLLGFTAP